MAIGAVLAGALTARAADVAAPNGALSLKHCLVTAVDDVQVPALRAG